MRTHGLAVYKNTTATTLLVHDSFSVDGTLENSFPDTVGAEDYQWTINDIIGNIWPVNATGFTTMASNADVGSPRIDTQRPQQKVEAVIRNNGGGGGQRTAGIAIRGSSDGSYLIVQLRQAGGTGVPTLECLHYNAVTQIFTTQIASVAIPGAVSGGITETRTLTVIDLFSTIDVTLSGGTEGNVAISLPLKAEGKAQQGSLAGLYFEGKASGLEYDSFKIFG